MERLQTLDTELARRAGEAGRLRFEMGRGLDLLEQSGGHHALGFSSIEAYALERCERSASWTQKARSLARPLERVPALAEALISGSLSWSMAAALATVASPDDAEFWLTEASRRTVREMKALVLEKRGVAQEGDPLEAEAEAELRTLTLTVPREDTWCFEQAKLLGRHLGERTNADLVLDSAELLARWSESTAVLPPSDAEVRRVEDLERAVVTGQMSAPPALPPTAGAPSATVTLHLRVSADTARDFRHFRPPSARKSIDSSVRGPLGLRVASSGCERDQAARLELLIELEPDRTAVSGPAARFPRPRAVFTR